MDTPKYWVASASSNEELLLVDHANCERKAAGSALALIHRFADDRNACMALSRVVREEMRHFEQVLSLIHLKGYAFTPLGPSRYARGLHRVASALGCEIRISELLVAAIIEARSCERFRLLVDALDPPVSDLYERLSEAEERHFALYLNLANECGDKRAIEAHLKVLLDEDAKLITENDEHFRFHSGPPSIAKHSNASSD